ncbi:MAG: hypothetical protein AAGD32_13100 [Planctomycetota bacterium]
MLGVASGPHDQFDNLTAVTKAAFEPSALPPLALRKCDLPDMRF